MVYLAKCCHSDVSSVRRAEYPLEILNSADSFTMQNKRQQFCWTFFSISTSLSVYVRHLLLQWFDATIFYSFPNIDRCYQCLFKLKALYMFKSWKDKSAVCSKGKRRWRRKWSTQKNRGTTNEQHEPLPVQQCIGGFTPPSNSREKILLRIWNMLRSHETFNYKAEKRRCF